MKIFLTTFILLLSTQNALANCRSNPFASWNIVNKAYPAGAEAFYTSSNWVDTRIYQHSNEIFSKIHQLVQGAEKHVYLQTWTFHPKTKPALYLADAIQKLHSRRVKEGKNGDVHIWLMLNIIGLQNEKNEQRKMDEYIQRHGLNLPGIKIHVGFFKAKLLGANHVKTVSIDHKVALITGANFSPSNNKNGFFDLGFVVKGDVLKNLDYDFVQTWTSFIKSGNKPKSWGQNLSGSSSSCTPIMVTRTKAFPNITRRIQKNSMTESILSSIRQARKNIEIITPNLNVTPLMDELARAALRGVSVRIILSKGFTDISQDLPTRGGTNTLSISRMHKGLSKYLSTEDICRRLQIRWYALDGVNVIDSNKPPNSHAKFMLIDNEISFFGSANMDNQSWVNSREISLFVHKKSLATRWTDRFYNPIFKRSVPVDRCR